MSIKVMTMVWDGFPAAGSELLVMLALADRCDDRGGSLFPSIKAVGEKARIGEKHARNIMHKFERERFLAVVGNHAGGKPGTTRQYRLNIGKLKLLADEANAKREAEKAAKFGAKKSADDQWEDVFATAPLEVTPPLEVTRTAPPQFRDGSPAVPSTAPLEVTLSTIDPPMDSPSIPAPLAGLPAVVEIGLPAKQKKPRAKAEPDEGTEAFKAARSETWAAYSNAYQARYGAAPLPNLQNNSKMKQFVQRVPFDEAPGIAAFFVRINDAFLIRMQHSVGALLQNAEGYRTQWATGQAMTNTRAQQADKTQSNFDAAEGAKAILRARWKEKNAE